MVTPKQAGRIGVQVVHVANGRNFAKDMLVPVGQSVGWCVNASGIAGLYPDIKGGKVGVWGRLVKPEAIVLEGDRIEVYTACMPEAVAKARKLTGIKTVGGIVGADVLGDNNS